MPRQSLGIFVHSIDNQHRYRRDTDLIYPLLTALTRSKLSRQSTKRHSRETAPISYCLGSACAGPVDVTTSRGVSCQVGAKLKGRTSTSLHVRGVNQSRSSNTNITDVSRVESHSYFAQGSASVGIDQNTGYILTGSTKTTILQIESISCCDQFNLSSSAVSNQSLGRTSEVNSFTDSRTNGVVLVGRQGNCSQDADDRNHDHQFNQGKTFLSFHG